MKAKFYSAWLKRQNTNKDKMQADRTLSVKLISQTNACSSCF